MRTRGCAAGRGRCRASVSRRGDPGPALSAARRTDTGGDPLAQSPASGGSRPARAVQSRTRARRRPRVEAAPRPASASASSRATRSIRPVSRGAPAGWHPTRRCGPRPRCAKPHSRRFHRRRSDRPRRSRETRAPAPNGPTCLRHQAPRQRPGRRPRLPSRTTARSGFRPAQRHRTGRPCQARAQAVR